MEFEDFFEQIASHHKQSLPFVAYQKPNSYEVRALLQKDSSLHTIVDYTESGFVFAPFDSGEEAVIIPFEHSEQLFVIDTSNLRFPATRAEQSFSKAGIQVIKKKSPLVENESERVFHIDLVQKGIEAIVRGDLRKVVLSRKETLKLSMSNPFKIFKRLLAAYPSAFVYCFYHPKVGTWLGATPETLLQMEGHRFYTSALAGTQPYKDTLDVKWEFKEKEEQNMVTKFIIENLQPLVHHLKVEPVETIKAGSLLHLKTNISGTLNFKTFKLNQILGSLHPTPAVCGLPKADAKQFILANENYNREFYTGFLGELNLKERKMRRTKRHNAENDAFAAPITVSNIFVNLRCMQLKPDKAMIYVGGGITKDSEPQSEWKETVNKTDTIKSIL